MKKHIISLVLCVLILFAFTGSAFAAEITDVKTDFPDISAAIACSDGEAIDLSKVSATLDGKKLKVKDDAGDKSTEWIILIDTSKSSKQYFDSEKAAIVSIYESLGEKDSLKLYSFKETAQAVLGGSESKEDAIKKINAIKCDGEDTVFYDAVSLMLDDVKSSKADKCVPLIISDGKDTKSALKKDEITSKISESAVPVYGYYAENLAGDTAKEFDSFLKLSGGGAKPISPDTASSVIASAAKTNNPVIHFEASEAVKANDNAVLSIDLGDGKSITKKVPVKEWTPKSDETQTSAKSTSAVQTTEPATQPGDDDSDGGLMKILIPVLAVLLIAALAFVLLKKKKPADNDKKDKKNGDNSSEDGKETEAEAEAEAPEEAVDGDEVSENAEEKADEAGNEAEEAAAAAAVIADDKGESEETESASNEEKPAAPAVDKKAEKAKAQEEERKAKEGKKAEDKKKAESDKAAKDIAKEQKKKDAEREKIRKMKKAEAEKKAKETRKAEAKKKAEEEKEAKRQKSIDDKQQEAAKKAESKKKVNIEIATKDNKKAEKQKEAEREKFRKMKQAEAEKKAKEVKKAEAKKKAEEEKLAKKQKKIDDKKHQEATKKAQQFQFYFEDKGDGKKK